MGRPPTCTWDRVVGCGHRWRSGRGQVTCPECGCICVDVYIDGMDNPPVRVMFDLGGHEIEIDDGPVNGLLDDIRAELGG